MDILIGGEIHSVSLFSLKEYTKFFLLYYKKEVSVSDRMEFVNGWYVTIIISDILTITGSVLKMEIQAKVIFFLCMPCFRCVSMVMYFSRMGEFTE